MTEGKVFVFQSIHFVSEYDRHTVLRENRNHLRRHLTWSSDIFTLSTGMPRCPDDEPMVGERLSEHREHRCLLDDLVGARGKLDGVLMFCPRRVDEDEVLKPMFIMHRAVAPMLAGVFVSTSTMLILSRSESGFIG